MLRLAFCIVAATSLASADPLALPDRLVLNANEIEARVTAEVELAPRQFAMPLSLAPDIWLGVTSRLTVGLIHSNGSVSRIDRAASYCIVHTLMKTTARTLGCDRTYSNAGLDVRYLVSDGLSPRERGPWSVAMRGRLLVRDVDPWKPAITVGALVRWQRGRFAITGDPYLRFGLDNTQLGNRTFINIPIVASVRPIAPLVVALHTGYDTDVAIFHDGFHIPLALSLRTRLGDFEVGALVGFGRALGPQDTTSGRVLWLWLGGHVGATRAR